MAALTNFLYRQRKRVKYHFATDPLQKRIAEINRFKEVVGEGNNGYQIKGIDVSIPKTGFEFIFNENVFGLFTSIVDVLSGRYYLDQEKLFFTFDDVVIEIKSPSELYIINEVFSDKCYQFLLPPSFNVRVIDIGMNVGIASLFFAGLQFVNGVHGFEPFRSTFLQAQANFALNNTRAAKIQSNGFGLGAVAEETVGFYNSSNSGTSSNKTFNTRRYEGRSEYIQIKPAFETVYDLLAKYPDEVFVLKIDTEGSEYEIFDSLFREELSRRVKVIMVEWHFQGAEQLEKVLLANGFSLTSFRLNINSGLIYAFR